RELPVSDRETRARELAQAWNARPFDLGTGPLFRPLLIRIEDRESLLVLNLHHIICDGRSLEILINDLGEMYSALRDERVPVLPALSASSLDYATTEREQLTGP